MYVQRACPKYLTVCFPSFNLTNSNYSSVEIYGAWDIYAEAKISYKEILQYLF